MKTIPALGTAVRIDLNKGERSWANKDFAHGDVVKVVGRTLVFYGRTTGFSQPGVYENPSYTVVENKRGEQFEIPSVVLVEIPAVSEIVPAKSREDRRIGDLPETELWEDDVVRDAEGNVLRIQHIFYEDIGRFRNDCVTPMPIYAAAWQTGGYSQFQGEELTLIERGNVWKHAHGEETNFADTQEEIEFHIRIGARDELKNPRMKAMPYRWDKEDAAEAIRSGYGDYIKQNNRNSLYKFHDPEIGKIAREYWLQQNDHDTKSAHGNL